MYSFTSWRVFAKFRGKLCDFSRLQQTSNLRKNVRQRNGFVRLRLNCNCTKNAQKASIFFLLQVQWVTLRRDTNPMSIDFPLKFRFGFVQLSCAFVCFFRLPVLLLSQGVQSIISVGYGISTFVFRSCLSQYVHSENLSWKKDRYRMRMKSMRYGYRVQNSDFDLPPGKRKSYYIIVGDLQWFRGVYCFPLILHWLGKKVGKYIFSRSPDGLNSHLFNPDLKKQWGFWSTRHGSDRLSSGKS